MMDGMLGQVSTDRLIDPVLLADRRVPVSQDSQTTRSHGVRLHERHYHRDIEREWTSNRAHIRSNYFQDIEGIANCSLSLY